MISLLALQGAVELGLGYGLMALGLYISYRILNVADLTVDGSFTLGAAVSAVLATAGYPLLAFVAAMAAGALAGAVSALLQTKLSVQPILAGILVMTGLYSINLMVMGEKPNISLLGVDTLLTYMAKFLPESVVKLVVAGAFVAVVLLLLLLFFSTQLGLVLRATGDNEDMVRSSSINADMVKLLGLAMANGIVALSGALLAQMQRFSDAGMGIGMVVIGLASIIIGEAIFGRGSVPRSMLAVVCGSVVYRLIIALVLEMGLSQSYLKLISALVVTAAISYPTISGKLQLTRQKRQSTREERSTC